MTGVRCLVIGESLVDIVDGRATPGGSPMNVAVGLRRLGIDAALATRIGSDAHGLLVRSHLDDSGVTLTDGSVVTGPSTSTATASLAPDGSARYEFDVDWTLDAPRLDGFAVLHTGSIGAVLEPGGGVVRGLFADADPSILKTYDPNIRPALMPRTRATLRRIEDMMAAAHVVKLSDEDAAWLYPGEDPAEVVQRLVERGPAIAVVTRGGDGCVAACRGDGAVWERQAARAQVVDTIGAGDAFMSGLICGLAEAGADGAAMSAGDPVEPSGLSSAIDLALLCGGITVSRAGANPPHRADILAATGR